MANTRGSAFTGKFVDIFKNTLNFPAFDDLPCEYDLDEDYYEEDPHDGVYKQARTWRYHPRYFGLSCYF